MNEPRIYGHTSSGRPITDAEIEARAAEAEAGYDVDELIARRGKRGRPELGCPGIVRSLGEGELTSPTINEVPGILAGDPDVSCVATDDRFVVLYAVSFDHDSRPSATGEQVQSPHDAAHSALELTRDVGSGDTAWMVFDTLTQEWTTFTQSEIERS